MEIEKYKEKQQKTKRPFLLQNPWNHNILWDSRIGKTCSFSTGHLGLSLKSQTMLTPINLYAKATFFELCTASSAWSVERSDNMADTLQVTNASSTGSDDAVPSLPNTVTLQLTLPLRICLDSILRF